MCKEHARITGQDDPFFPAKQASDLVCDLIASGITADNTTAATGIDRHTITALRRGTATIVRRSTERRLQALAESPDLDRWRNQPAWRAQRRLRSLQAAGWRQHELARELGVSQGAVSNLVNGNRVTLTPAEFAKIARLYRAHEHDTVRAPDWRTSRHQWVPPLWWDNIDDPAERPGETHCKGCHGRRIDTKGQCRKCYERRWKQRRKAA